MISVIGMLVIVGCLVLMGMIIVHVIRDTRRRQGPDDPAL